MIAHDSKIYWNPRLEPFDDPEYEAAATTNEPDIYYWVIGGKAKYVKKYKPAVAKLFEKRTGMQYISIQRWSAEK
jgi:hypothetical protein